MRAFIAAIDQGTTSTRAMIFDRAGRVVAFDQRSHHQHYPASGWVEHDAEEIWEAVQAVIQGAMTKADLTAQDLAAVGITNQRETTVVWDRHTGQALAPAIVWQDTRTQALCDHLAAEFGKKQFQAKTGLPLATYFSGTKLSWLLEHTPGLRKAAEKGDACFGTVDSWLIFKLTGQHITDVSNASRSLLFDLHRMDWDPELLQLMGIPPAMLPALRPSSDPRFYGLTQKDGPFLGEVPVTGALGDQQAAMVGQVCFRPGETKNTYGTGCFLLMNTGETVQPSHHGLLSTVLYQLGEAPPVYALEGSIAIAGALVEWLRDRLGIIEKSQDIEALAESVPDNGGVVIIPAFSGLFAPHWRPDARGAILGLTRFATKAHLARAALEAVAYQTREILEAMRSDAETSLSVLKVDGGMVDNRLLMQMQADVLGIEVSRPKVIESTALGAAYAAGLAVGFYESLESLRENWLEAERFKPDPESPLHRLGYARYQASVPHSFDGVA